MHTRIGYMRDLPAGGVNLLENILLGYIEYVALVKGVLMAEKIIIF